MKRTRSLSLADAVVTGVLIGILAIPPQLLYAQAAAAPVVIRHEVNGGAKQRSNVDSGPVLFSEDVSASLKPEHLLLRNLKTGDVLDPSKLIRQLRSDANRAAWDVSLSSRWLRSRRQLHRQRARQKHHERAAGQRPAPTGMCA